jgi:(1->4)-alpha-D-glucan 1-alpha-D-glucosylmutase
VLSELPKQWKERVLRWKKMNRAAKTAIGGELVPGSNEEYLLYQTLLGAWPLDHMSEQDCARFVERIQAYMNKAVREAKEHTSWISPDLQYEEAVGKFVASLLDRSWRNAFLEDFLSFEEGIAQYGLYNSLSQLLIKIVAPGVPDFYQGTELWDFSLVDPDNRRVVDFEVRTRFLADIRRACETTSGRQALVRELLGTRTDGRIKLFVTTEGLRYRRAHPDLFRHGTYVPLHGMGEKQDHLFAFARLHGGEAVVAIVPRLLTSVMADPMTPPIGDKAWANTEVAMPDWKEPSRFRNILTDERVSTTTAGGKQVLLAGRLFNMFPIAFLERET